jgi:uncharacterized protein (DUF58 family)
MLSFRGLVLSIGAFSAAIAGLVYGVEEFVLVALSVTVLLLVGWVWARRREGLIRGGLRTVMRVPTAEVAAGQSALVELTVTNAGRRYLPPVLVKDPRQHWSVSHPGLGDGHRRGGASHAGPGRADSSSVTGRRATGDPRVGAGVGAGWVTQPGDRRQRRRERRVLSRSLRLPDLGPGRGAALTIPVPTAARGVLTLSGVELWCEDPFRLFSRRVTEAPPAHVVVYPSPAGDLSTRPPNDRSHVGSRSHPHSSTPGVNGLAGDELSGLRPYEPGDRLTRLHWPAFARTGELVVREFVELDAGSLALLVDVRPSVHTDVSMEAAVSEAAALGLAALERGVGVNLCTSAGDRLSVDPHTGGRQALLRALAMLGRATAPPAAALRWADRPTGGALWATNDAFGASLILVTTEAGVAQNALPDRLACQADTVVVP